jgi:hypothetical protein
MTYEEYREDVVVMMLTQQKRLTITPIIEDGRALFWVSSWPKVWESALQRFMTMWVATERVNDLFKYSRCEEAMADYATYLCGEGEEE